MDGSAAYDVAEKASSCNRNCFVTMPPFKTAGGGLDAKDFPVLETLALSA